MGCNFSEKQNSNLLEVKCGVGWEGFVFRQWAFHIEDKPLLSLNMRFVNILHPIFKKFDN